MLKDGARKIAQKIKKAVYNPNVRRISKFAASFLETISYVDSKNPLSVVAATISFIDSGVEAFDVPLPTKVEQYALDHELEEKLGWLARIVVASGIVNSYPSKVVVIDDKLEMRQIKFKFGNFYYLQYNGPENSSDEYSSILNWYFLQKDFPLDKLFDLIWDQYDGGVFVSKSSDDEDGPSLRTVKMHKLCTSDMMYVGDNPNTDKFVLELEKFLSKGRSRSYMFAGPPGTGKTTFAIEVSKRIGNRTLKLDPSVAKHMGSGEFEFIVRNLSPDSIVFDDFDRAINDSGNLLFLLENIKQQFPDVVIFATVNFYEELDPAIKRPGRFDKTIWFELPSEKERKKIAKFYLDQFNVKYSNTRIKQVAVATEGMSPAYIRELCNRVEIQGWKEMPLIIEEFKRALASDDIDDEEEDGKNETEQ